jgi:4'-phosphopantetheinyl transferase
MSTLEILWTLPDEEAPALEHDSVHVWAASLEVAPHLMPQFERTLCPEESGRASRFRFEEHRKRFIAARGVLRQLLGSYCGQPPEQIALQYGRNGKPHLEGGPGLHFNLAHSGELALYAFSRETEVGVDLERLAFIPEADEIAARFFSTSEAAALGKMSEQQREAFFFQCWTRKEAVLKCNGSGLGVLEDRKPEDSREERGNGNRDGDSSKDGGIFTCELHPARGYVAHLAACRAPARIAAWLWTPGIGTWEGGLRSAHASETPPLRRGSPLQH